MPFISQELSALWGEIKRVRYVFTDEDGDAIDLSAGVTFTGKLYDEEQTIATYANGSYITTLASSGYIDLLVDCLAPGRWKLALSSAFAAGPTTNKHILWLNIDFEEAPTVTRALDTVLPDLRIEATGSG
jgi:hypothetical protein